MTFGNIKKGDTVYSVENLGRRSGRVTECKVTSVGKKWITVQLGKYNKQKFNAETGYGKYGMHVHTEATLNEARERLELIARIELIAWFSQDIKTLRAVVAALDNDSNLKE